MSSGLTKAEGQMKTFGTSTTGATKSMSVMPVVAVAAGAALVKLGADSVKSFMEAQQIMAQTQAVLKSTGGQAGVTAQDIVALTGKLRDLTGIDDEAIQSSSNLLLTFRDVHNEVGKGNDIFNQAQVAILDMSTALNKGAIPSADQLKSSTIALGKALNDPVAGMTALKRVGVSFNESQIKTIQSLQASGDLMGAQKIILGELKAEFGGAAKAAGQTFAGQLAILKSQLGDVEEEIGAALMPALMDLTEVGMKLARDIVPALKVGFELAAAGASTLAEDLNAVITPIDAILGKLPGMNSESTSLTDRIVNFGKAVQQLINPLDKIANPSHLIPWFAWRDAVRTATGVAEDGTAKIEDLSVGVHGAGDAIAGLRQPLNEASGGLHRFAGMSHDAFKEFRSGALDSIRSAGTGLADWSSSLTLTGGKTKRNMQGMAEDARTMARDYKELDRTAVPEKFKAFLITEGPTAVHGFVTANQGAQRDIVRAWKQMQDSLQSALQTMKRIASDGGHEVGSNLSRGVLAGIASQSASVRAAASKVISDAIEAAKAAAKIKSPSEEMHKVGVQFMQGLINAIVEMAGKFDEVIGASMEHAISRFSNDLDKLKSRIQDWKSDISSGFGSFDLIGGLLGLEEGTDPSAFIAQTVQAAQQFGAALTGLQAAGLKTDLLRQIAAQGAEALPLAQALLADPAMLQQLNRSQAAIDRIEKATSREVLGEEFGHAIDRLGDRLEKIAGRLMDRPNQFTFNGWVGNDQDIARRIRDELLKLEKRNAGTGL